MVEEEEGREKIAITSSLFVIFVIIDLLSALSLCGRFNRTMPKWDLTMNWTSLPSAIRCF